MDKKVTLTQLTYSELQSLIIDCVFTCLREFKPTQQQSKGRDEVGRVGFAMEITGKGKSTIYHLVQNDLIPHSRRGKHLYFKRGELEDWLTENRNKTVQEMVDEVGTAAIEQMVENKRRAQQ